MELGNPLSSVLEMDAWGTAASPLQAGPKGQELQALCPPPGTAQPHAGKVAKELPRKE